MLITMDRVHTRLLKLSKYSHNYQPPTFEPFYSVLLRVELIVWFAV